MAYNGTTTPNLDSLSISDTELDDNTEDLFASPSVPAKKPEAVQQPNAQQVQSFAPPADNEEDARAAHEASLRRELSSLRTMNQVISGVVESLERAKGNMDTVSATVSNASALLSTWTRILSQTEHNERLILNPSWQGASQDLADGENDEVLRRQEKERRQADEHRREEAREREREEEERRRMTEGSTTKGPQGRGRGVGRRATRGATSGYVGVGGQGGVRGTVRGNSTPARVGSGIGRGLGVGRGRGRGV